MPILEAQLWRVNVGTMLTVVAAVTKEDAAAIARERFRQAGHPTEHCRPRPATLDDWLAFQQRLATIAELER